MKSKKDIQIEKMLNKLSESEKKKLQDFINDIKEEHENENQLPIDNYLNRIKNRSSEYE